jgi:hypothetical protein
MPRQGRDGDVLASAVAELESGLRWPLRDLPDNPHPPKGPPGVYTLWHDEEFLYCGMAYKDATETTNPQAAGLWGRLRTHWAGRRTGYLNVQVLDRFIIPELSKDELSALRVGDLSLAARLRAWMHQHADYRAWISPDGSSAREVEDHIRSTGLPMTGPPQLNPK